MVQYLFKVVLQYSCVAVLILPSVAANKTFIYTTLSEGGHYTQL